MSRPPASEPTEVELQILRILWERGPSTARQVHEALQAMKSTNYSTTVKMLGVMLEKQLVARDDSVRPQVFQAAHTRPVVQRKMLRRMVDTVYGGSLKALVLQALSSKEAESEDLTEIRALIEDLEAKEGNA
ncbi:MAG: BlaI/MecI/CopY family transcriptional regulator [Planctomycetota bacterium]|nr:MAG: BlaI/MecI/CopY family transcriptional regulator [Planctomycetota bacterium]